MPPTVAGRRQKLRWPAWSAAAIALFAATATAWGAPLTSNTALPVAKGEFVFRQQFVFDRSGDDPSGAGRDREAFAAVAALGYGVSRNLAVFGVLPYVDRRLELTAGGQRLARSARGIGDASLFARYTVFQKNWPQRTLRVAPFAGLELPTGADDETDAFGRLPAAVQPGSGSLDPFGGIVATYQTLDFQIDAQLAYKANIEANNFAFGDVARLDLSLQVRLLPRVLSGGVPGFLYGIVEANLIHRGHNEIGGVEDANSGGATLFVVPGLQYVTKRWIVEAGIQLPAFQNLNGTALGNDYVVRGGFRFNF